MKFIKKPIEIDAKPWFNHGDHPKVEKCVMFSHISFNCEICRKGAEEHGVIGTLEGQHRVCPGDYIICGIKGEYYPCKPDIFHASYEIADTIIKTPTDLKKLTETFKEIGIDADYSDWGITIKDVSDGDNGDHEVHYTFDPWGKYIDTYIDDGGLPND